MLQPIVSVFNAVSGRPNHSYSPASMTRQVGISSWTVGVLFSALLAGCFGNTRKTIDLEHADGSFVTYRPSSDGQHIVFDLQARGTCTSDADAYQRIRGNILQQPPFASSSDRDRVTTMRNAWGAQLDERQKTSPLCQNGRYDFRGSFQE